MILRDGDLLPTFLLPSSPRLLAISSSQWASQDHICQHLPSPDRGGFARSQLPALDRSGPCPTSTASSWSQWASPDLNRRESERRGPRRTSTGESLSAVGFAGAQPGRTQPSHAWLPPQHKSHATTCSHYNAFCSATCASLNHRVPKSPLPKVTTSLSQRFPKSPLPLVTTFP